VSRELRQRVDAALRDFLDRAAPALDAIADDLRPLTGSAARFVLAGGKRLRPAFCYWAARAVGAPDGDALVRAAASLELLQACALVHDDVIDRSATRRGMPSVHEQLAALHASSGWVGDPADFGTAGAILLGDLFLVWSGAMFATSGLDDDALVRAHPIADTMRVELMAGQFLDVVEQARGGGSVDRALRVARFKSAKYTVERPLHLGGAIADAPASAMEAFSGFGLPLGEAFQLRDDLLGAFGDSARTGKPVGDDLREGKPTPLLALAVARSGPRDQELLARVGSPDLTPGDVAALQQLFEDTGARADVEADVDRLARQAVAAIEAAPVPAEACEALVELAGFIAARDT
jgi:geranylgeranyl diphosphate synthase, type I